MNNPNEYFTLINNNYNNFKDINFIWTIPFKDFIKTPSSNNIVVRNQSYTNNDYLRNSPSNSNDFNSIVSSFPQVNEIITPSWYCSAVFVALNRYNPLSFNQIYLDNKDKSKTKWEISNSGGIDKGSYWLYLGEGSGIYMDFPHSLRAMNKVHAIYTHLQKLSPQKSRESLLKNTLDLIIKNSYSKSLESVYAQYKSLFSANSQKRNYFVVEGNDWDNFFNTVKNEYENNYINPQEYKMI